MSAIRSVPTELAELQESSTGHLVGKVQPEHEAFLPSIDATTLATWMGIGRTAVLELAHSGALPCRVGSKGLTFDVVEVQRHLIATRQNAPYVLPGHRMREIVCSLSNAPTVIDAWEAAASHLMVISGAHTAAVFVADPEAWLRPLRWIGADPGPRRTALESVAAWVAITKREVSLGAPIGELQTAEDLSGHVAGLPVEFGDGLAGVVALDGRGHGHSMGPGRMAAAQAVVAQLALVLQASEARHELLTNRITTDLNQRQMEAFALDVRSSFSAEKERAEELAGALDELERTYLATVRGLAVAVEAKDEYTGGHLQRSPSTGWR